MTLLFTIRPNQDGDDLCCSDPKPINILIQDSHNGQDFENMYCLEQLSSLTSHLSDLQNSLNTIQLAK